MKRNKIVFAVYHTDILEVVFLRSDDRFDLKQYVAVQVDPEQLLGIALTGVLPVEIAQCQNFADVKELIQKRNEQFYEYNEQDALKNNLPMFPEEDTT